MSLIRRVPKNIVEFTAGDDGLTPYLMFADYMKHWRKMNGDKTVEYQKIDKAGNEVSFEDKEMAMNAELRKEIMRVAGVTSISPNIPFEQYANHPTIRWATFAVIGAMVDMILPDSLIRSIGLYTDVRSIGFGDSASFDIEPRDLFVVSKASRAKRRAEMKRQFNGQVTIVPENRAISVEVSLYKVLSGKESLANFVSKAIMSIESEVARDVYTVFNTAMEALVSSGDAQLLYAGYTQTNLVTLCQKVSAWNGGRTPIVCGTQLALQSVLPADSNYRYDIDSEFVKLGYVKTMAGYDTMVLPQVADWTTEFSTLLDNANLYVISPAANKLVKLVLEGSTLSNVSGVWENANLTQDGTLFKSWGAAIATNSLAGTITL